MSAQVMAKSNKSSEILTNERCLWVRSQKQCYFFYEKLTWFDFCFEDVTQNFNQGKLLTIKLDKTSRGNSNF